MLLVLISCSSSSKSPVKEPPSTAPCTGLMFGKAPAGLGGRRAGLAGSPPALLTGNSPQLPSAHTHDLQGALGQGKGDARDPTEPLDSKEGVVERAEMLRSSVDHSRNHFCLPCATPAAFPARKCKQPPGAMPLILHCCTKLLASQLPSAPQTGWDPPSSAENPKAPSALPGTFPLPFPLAEPRISTWGIPVGRIKAGPRLDHSGEGAAAGCTTSGTAAHLLHVGLLRATKDTAGGPGVPQGQEGQGHIVWGVLAAGLSVEHLPLEEPRHDVGDLGKH